jgi:hypothetical protein
MTGVCRFCGKEAEGQSFNEWVRDTFTDHDKLLPGNIICDDCSFWFDESSSVLAQKVGKDKPQRTRNYSQFVVNGEWTPLSKGDKPKMVELLLGESFPELAAIADSGQKHIVFRASRNPQGSKAGWVQFEEQRLWVIPLELKSLIETIEAGLLIFSKSEIESGNYLPHRIIQFGLEKWQEMEAILKPRRNSLLLKLAIFLSQKKETETDDTVTSDSSGIALDHLARDRQRVQKQIPPNDLGAIREHGTRQRVHEQPGEIRQLSLF